MDVKKYLESVKLRLDNDTAFRTLEDMLYKMEKSNVAFGLGEVELARICKGFIIGYELGKITHKSL